jgi:hypothetical protein
MHGKKVLPIPLLIKVMPALIPVQCVLITCWNMGAEIRYDPSPQILTLVKKFKRRRKNPHIDSGTEI